MKKGHIIEVLPYGMFSTVIVLLVKTRNRTEKIVFDHRNFRHLLEDFGISPDDLIGKGIEYNNGFGDDSFLRFKCEHCIDRLKCLIDEQNCNLCNKGD